MPTPLNQTQKTPPTQSLLQSSTRKRNINDPYAYDLKALGLAKQYLASEALLLAHLIEMRKRRHFASLNYTGIFDYCERRLKLSRAQAYYFKTVAEKSDEVPEIKQAVVAGELTLSQARRIVPVINKTNHREWIEKAKELPQRELEREVTSVNPQAHVREKMKWVAKELSELRIPLDPTAAANLTALQNVLSQKLHKAASMGEVIAWALEIVRNKFDPIQRAHRSAKLTKKTQNKDNVAQQVHPSRVPSSLNQIRNQQPKAHIAISPPPQRVPIPAAVKHAVVLRDQMRCTFISSDGARCRQQRWIHIHHIREWSKGGLNEIENLRLLCRAHHALEHSRGGPKGRGG